MKIRDILNENLVVPELQGKGKVEVLNELVDCIVRNHPNLDRDRVLEILLERERLGSTGIGEGVAIPHGKLPGLEGLVGCFGRSREGVDFQSIDGRPTRLFFVLLAPENSAGVHLKALARVSRLFKSEAFRERLVEGDGQADLFRTIAEEDAKY